MTKPQRASAAPDDPAWLRSTDVDEPAISMGNCRLTVLR